MSGLLIGILLSRTLSGFIGAHLGWRAVFLAGGIAMIILILILAAKLPQDPPTFNGSYGALMRSLGTLVRELPPLRQAAATGFLMFGAFSVFWTTLVFLLEGPPFHFKSDMVGMFGVIGACGALAAPLAGKSADAKGPQYTIRLGILAGIAAYAIMGFSGASLLALIAGVILLDVGMQVTHISNQSKVFALHPEARSRLNTVYISSSFAGGSLGSLLGARAWSAYGWTGVCLLGASMIALAFIINLKQRKHQP
jgi:predicted MFS family arabinose efflux permease